MTAALDRAPASFEVVKLRPWSAVYRARGPDGSAYFKALCAGSAHEPAVVAYLAARRPDQLPAVLHADPDRAWLLVGDGGPTLRDVDPDEDPAHWERVLPRYAELQRSTAVDADTWLELGVPDRRLERLPALAAELAERPGVAGALDGAELERLRRDVTEECRRLAASGLPAALDHGDLHGGNVLARGYRLFDWGDCCLTHPFFSLPVTLSSLDASPAVRARLVDAYLGPWTADRPRAELDRALPLAFKLGSLARALDWHGVLEGAAPRDVAEWGPRVTHWLRAYLRA